MTYVTTEAAQQIEESLDELYAELAADSHRDGPRCLMLTTAEKALSTIRAARAQADHIADADKMVQEPVAFTDQHTQYVMQYGGTCRDCADENGSCPNAGGLPCDGRSKAIAYVFRAIEYGVNNGFISAPVERQWVDLTDDEILSIPYLYTGELKTSMVNFARAVIAADRRKNK